MTSNANIQSGTTVFEAKTQIVLEANFQVHLGATFTADIVPCAGGAAWQYEYFLQDHLGNNRVLFADENGNNLIEATEVLQENHYYPFGMEMHGGWLAEPGVEQRYGYNGKELHEEVGWHDYGARWYDAAVGRWNAVDPLAEKMSNWSPYNYVYNNPIAYIDPLGLSPYTYNWATEQYEDNEGNSVDWNTVYSSIQGGAETRINASIALDESAEITTSRLGKILNHTTQIYARQGFGPNLFKFKILTSIEGRRARGASKEELFLAIIRSSTKGRYPGFSEVAFNGITRGYGGADLNSGPNGYQSWVNLTNVSDNIQGTFMDYDAGYIIAHELLHQIVLKANLIYNGVNPRYSSDGPFGIEDHYDEPLNLNTHGQIIGPLSPGSSKETILPVHRNLIRLYISYLKYKQ
ncbi:RHS repeat domain-containing protein [Neolewinella lacunae]|uniref:RHS repeat domain-containing protein n=1 Tax=Neolewinella lacunae TaxID=1517758 RepID=UPI003872B630